MKTLGIVLLVIGSVVGVTGVVMKPEKKEIYSASFSIDIPPMEVNYAQNTSGAIESWTHCGICRQGVIRHEDGKCSYCGKGPNDEQGKE